MQRFWCTCVDSYRTVACFRHNLCSYRLNNIQTDRIDVTTDMDGLGKRSPMNWTTAPTFPFVCMAICTYICSTITGRSSRRRMKDLEVLVIVGDVQVTMYETDWWVNTRAESIPCGRSIKSPKRNKKTDSDIMGSSCICDEEETDGDDAADDGDGCSNALTLFCTDVVEVDYIIRRHVRHRGLRGFVILTHVLKRRGSADISF